MERRKMKGEKRKMKEREERRWRREAGGEGRREEKKQYTF